MRFLLPLFFAVSLVASIIPSQVQKEKYLYPLGKKILKECQALQNKHFHSFEALSVYIHKHCDLEEKRYEEALAWYLWDQKYKRADLQTTVEFHYTKKDKCPVCGMFVYKYPKWVAMLKAKNSKTLYFDGVKDMLKYYFDHQSDALKLYAQDYYSKKIINLRKAFLVLGSDIYGPMGEEIIPFEKKEEAKSFMLDHHAKKILKFKDLDKRTVEVLDE